MKRIFHHKYPRYILCHLIVDSNNNVVLYTDFGFTIGDSIININTGEVEYNLETQREVGLFHESEWRKIVASSDDTDYVLTLNFEVFRRFNENPFNKIWVKYILDKNTLSDNLSKIAQDSDYIICSNYDSKKLFTLSSYKNGNYSKIDGTYEINKDFNLIPYFNKKMSVMEYNPNDVKENFTRGELIEILSKFAGLVDDEYRFATRENYKASEIYESFIKEL